MPICKLEFDSYTGLFLQNEIDYIKGDVSNSERYLVLLKIRDYFTKIEKMDFYRRLYSQFNQLIWSCGRGFVYSDAFIPTYLQSLRALEEGSGQTHE